MKNIRAMPHRFPNHHLNIRIDENKKIDFPIKSKFKDQLNGLKYKKIFSIPLD